MRQTWQYFINGLNEMDERIANLLSQFKGKYLFLNGLTHLNEKTIKALSQFNGQNVFLMGSIRCGIF